MSTRIFDFPGHDGQTLSGRLDLPDGPIRAFALFAHCFTCSKSSLASVRIARGLAARGIAVLRFDFTGLGESGGDFADTGVRANVGDIIAAAAAMRAAGHPATLLIGHSFGGAAALAAAGLLREVRAVATIAAPFEPRHVTNALGTAVERILADGEAEALLDGRPFTFRKAFLDDLADHNQAARVAALARPLLVLHAPGDDTVDVENAERIFAAAGHPKSFVSLDGADHLLTRREDTDHVAALISAWADPYVEGETVSPESEYRGVVVEDRREGGLRVRVSAGGVQFVADEPAEVGGLGSGPNPYDLLGAALGACTAMTLRLYADRKGLPLDGVRVEVGHAKDGGAPADLFVRGIELKGDLDAAQRARLMEIADKCPVHRTLTTGSRIETEMVDFSPVPSATPRAQPGTPR